MLDYLSTYKLPIIGGILGLLIGILFLTLGFFKTILVIILVGLGVAFGLYLDKTKLVDKFLSSKRN